MNYLTATPDFDRLFDNFFMGNRGHREASSSIPVRTTEEDDKYILKAEVPGLSTDDISVEFKDGNMTIKASYKEIDKDKDSMAFRAGSFSRTFDARDIDAESVHAELKDGILTLSMPKKAEAKSQMIAIKSA